MNNGGIYQHHYSFKPTIQGTLTHLKHTSNLVTTNADATAIYIGAINVNAS
jgi:hypothetical protein